MPKRYGAELKGRRVLANIDFSTSAKPTNDKTFSFSTGLMALLRYDAQDVGGHQ